MMTHDHVHRTKAHLLVRQRLSQSVDSGLGVYPRHERKYQQAVGASQNATDIEPQTIKKAPQNVQKGRCLTRPTPARQDVPFPGAAAAAGNTAGVPLGYVEDVGRAENEAREGARLGALGAGWVE
jgi:hypothetical protein